MAAMEIAVTAAQGIRLRLGCVVGWTAAALALVGGAGIYPTWRLAAMEGLRAELAAGLVVLAVEAGCGVFLVRQVPKGLQRFFHAHTMLRMPRVAASVALAAGAGWAAGLMLKAVFLWILVFAPTALVVDTVLLYQALRRSGQAAS